MLFLGKKTPMKMPIKMPLAEARLQGRFCAKPDEIGLSEALGDLRCTCKGSFYPEIRLDPPRST